MSFKYTEEIVQAKIIEALFEDLPEQLAKASEEPFRWLERAQNGRMAMQEMIVKLPDLREIWSAHHEILNYPALVVHYRLSDYESASECGEQDADATFQLDLILTHSNSEALNAMWFRYAEAIKRTLRSKNFNFGLQISGQQVTETGALSETTQLRRGLIGLSINF